MSVGPVPYAMVLNVGKSRPVTERERVHKSVIYSPDMLRSKKDVITSVNKPKPVLAWKTVTPYLRMTA